MSSEVGTKIRAEAILGTDSWRPLLTYAARREKIEDKSEVSMDKMSWIKDLVHAEIEMEESGIVDFSDSFDPEETLYRETIHYLIELKASFVEASSAFNQLKGSTVGRIKIYGISNREADFMLFRNGFKLIFSMVAPGQISIRFIHMGGTYVPDPLTDEKTGAPQPNEDLLQAFWGAFGDLIWRYHDKEIKLDYLVRFYLSRFIRESAK